MQHIDNGVPANSLTGVVWRKSHHSNPSGNCVEMALLPGGEVAVRNSRYPEGPALVYTGDEVRAFLAGCTGRRLRQHGRIDGPTTAGEGSAESSAETRQRGQAEKQPHFARPTPSMSS